MNKNILDFMITYNLYDKKKFYIEEISTGMVLITDSNNDKMLITDSFGELLVRINGSPATVYSKKLVRDFYGNVVWDWCVGSVYKR